LGFWAQFLQERWGDGIIASSAAQPIINGIPGMIRPSEQCITRRGSSRHARNQLLHPIEMGAFPIDLPAGGAHVEFLEILLRQRLQTLHDIGFPHRLQGMIAPHATLERDDPVRQLESLKDLLQLLARVEAAHQITLLDCLSHKQAATAR
jgi:hypothetical protein